MDPELPSQLKAERWYSAPRLWEKLRRTSKVLGKNAVLTILTLYHCLRDSDTPTWAKGVIVGALGYLIFPADLVPDIIPGAGYGDDWAAIVGALGTVAAYVKDIHKVKAAAQTEKLFGRVGR
ncbi:YkvA family protein [Haloferula sp.]|uniref:YkvA family protein n=1 Tax=Haloferula sp. TaxID=2497595 RepID=UPI003C72FA3C